MALKPPPPEVLEQAWTPILFFLLLVILATQGHPGVMFTSWWRGAIENADEGGHERSGHLMGVGLDVSPPSELLAASFRAVGLHVAERRGHLHVQLTPPPVLETVGLLRPAQRLGLVAV